MSGHPEHFSAGKAAGDLLAASHTTIADAEGLLRLFRHLAGRRLLGAVDGGNCVELVFDLPASSGGNLVTIFTGGYWRGIVSFGGVAQSMIDGGYLEDDR